MVAGPKLQQQVAPPQKPMYYVPKPDPGTKFRVVKTEQVGEGVVDYGTEILTAVERLQLGSVWAAKLDTVGEALEMLSGGP